MITSSIPRQRHAPAFRSTPLIACAVALLLSGCSMAPGGHIDYQTETAPIDDLVDIEPITPGLVSTFRLAESQAAPMSSDLRQAIEDYEYRVDPGDVLSVIVYDHPELTIPAGAERSAAEAGNEVRSDGTIFYPYIGRVKVAGLTLDEVRDMLARRLSGFLAEPQVDVRMAAFNSKKVYVSGSVATPGTQPITSVPLTLADAISRAGGAQPTANWHEVILTRNGQEQRLSLYQLLRQGDQTQNRLLQDGDVVHVPSSENQAVAVMGQVLSPGNFALGNERLSLTDAVARAGGINETTAEPSGIFVIRSQTFDSDKLATVYLLDVRNAAAFSMGSQFVLEPQDVVYVTTAPLARWNRVISLLLPSLVLPGSVAESASDVSDL
ncbi:polysaccharide biosynthesis/export family protein [Halomonas sp. KAO]|uniref:polysaccharide export protein n=1 Tax=unclassified Halomonas TaxID=2609666 RepID=UPI00189D7911|nr:MULTISPECIES: polysaccharide export protein [unclassified Halomonas]MBF7053197.1 polysaccharide biosynthesis/export family protein [Halomonas sp. KAO]MDT0499414.1 polysaccharide export protein [Halomonas sp. PAR7]MDT0510769.1 polysaccharide export protein [Halomonas sp. LES1]MDT0591702.1 polysaccharide export protein [Halomonas sp. PAR8]